MADSSETRTRVAWFTPLPPVESGISLYNQELLPLLATAWNVDVFVDGYRPSAPAETEHLRILPAREFRGRRRREPYAAVVYQMGNSPAHTYMYETALRVPGLLVLHDTLLHHLRLSMLLRRRGAGRYRALMERLYGDEGAETAARVLRGQIPESLFAYPLSEDLIRAARLVAVHSRFSAEQVRSLAPEASVERVPMGIPLPQLVDRSEARRRLSLPPDQFVIASITHINPYKRIDVVLRAVRKLRERLPLRVILAGSVSPLMPLDRLISLYGLTGVVEHLGYVSDETARLLVAASDACVNLRYPTAGETSASLLRTMGGARPVFVTDDGSFREIPDGAAVKIPPDMLEETYIMDLLEALAGRPELARTIGRNARAFIEREHSLTAMVSGYHRLLEHLTGRALPMPVIPDAARHEQLHLLNQPLPPGDPLTDAVADALLELGLGDQEKLLGKVADAGAEIGVWGKINGNGE